MWDPWPIDLFTGGAKQFEFGRPVDVEGYVRLTAYFRGEASAGSMRPPFCYRILAPLFASVVPTQPETALNIINLMSLLVSLWLLDQVGAALKMSARSRLAMNVTFIVSFPTFYYGTIGFIDPIALALSCAILLGVLRGFPPIVLLVIAICAVLAKETNAAFTLLPIFRAVQERKIAGKSLLVYGSIFAAPVGVHLLVRELMPFPQQQSLWIPDILITLENLSRSRTYISLILTITIPVTFALLALFSGRIRESLEKKDQLLLFAGCMLASGLYGYSVISAYSDGRIIWSIYPYLLPFSACLFSRRNSIRLVS
jgi:hypothetical protein